MTEYTQTQKTRLIQLGASFEETEKEFETVNERQEAFRIAEKEKISENKETLQQLFTKKHRPQLCILKEDLACALTDIGFTQVETPTIISAKALSKMGVNEKNPLHSQVFWLDKNTALRPMLAPGLYEISRQLMNTRPLPLKIFEIGSCFRKESEGRTHLKEFTMLNLVEWGTPMQERTQKLKEYSAGVLKAAGIENFSFENEDSVVYGEGLDVVSEDGLELASTSMGPHRLDSAWKINCTWIGAGFGLERLLMYREHKNGIHPYSRSTVYLDGACLKIN